MKDPYENVWKGLTKALTQLSDMIVWLAKRTLTVKEFQEFVDDFAEKKPDDMESALAELLKKKEE